MLTKPWLIVVLPRELQSSFGLPCSDWSVCVQICHHHRMVNQAALPDLPRGVCQDPVTLTQDLTAVPASHLVVIEFLMMMYHWTCRNLPLKKHLGAWFEQLWGWTIIYLGSEALCDSQSPHGHGFNQDLVFLMMMMMMMQCNVELLGLEQRPIQRIFQRLH